MVQVSTAALRAQLLDESLPLPLRFRILFSLKAVNTVEAVEALLAGLDDTSTLFRHEVAFALGQMQTPLAVEALVRKLADEAEHSMVRHEAAEALGAIALPECLAQLERFAVDTSREVAETCQLALGRIRYWQAQRAAAPAPSVQAPRGSKKETFAMAPDGAAGSEGSPYLSVDPVPAAPTDTPHATLRATLLDEAAPMFDRYGALFALRNRGGAAVARLLAEVLESSGSALLKHEVCYVLGQMQEADTVAALRGVLDDCSQHAMVRHEAAEALGSVAGPESRGFLQRHLADPDSIVAQGCLVALDILEYEESGAFCYTSVQLES